MTLGILEVVAAIGGALVGLVGLLWGAYWKGGRDRARRDYIDTRRKMDEVDYVDDPDDALDELQRRKQRRDL